MEHWLPMVPIYPLYIMHLGWEKLCLLLDYDGTLAPHGSHPDLTILPKQTKEVITVKVEESIIKILKCIILKNCEDLSVFCYKDDIFSTLQRIQSTG